MTEQFPRLRARKIKVTEFASLDSTNDYAKKQLAESPTQPFLVSAVEQTAGHGKFTRKFYSPAQSGAYFTLALPLSALAGKKWDPGRLTITAAVAAYQVLHDHFHQPLTVKWVNDLYLADKKVVGILAEAALNTDNRVVGVVIGWGINLTESPDWPASLRQQVGAVSTTPVSSEQRQLLIDELGNGFLELLKLPWSQVLQVYRDHQYLIGKHLLVDTGSRQVSGDYDHITDDGLLCLRTDSGLQTFAVGTVRTQ